MFPRLGLTVLAALTLAAAEGPKAGDEALGTQKYDAFERPAACASCHVDIARQHEQAMMSQAYTHHWDEIEYFELALPRAARARARTTSLPRTTSCVRQSSAVNVTTSRTTGACLSSRRTSSGRRDR